VIAIRRAELRAPQLLDFAERGVVVRFSANLMDVHCTYSGRPLGSFAPSNVALTFIISAAHQDDKSGRATQTYFVAISRNASAICT